MKILLIVGAEKFPKCLLASVQNALVSFYDPLEAREFKKTSTQEDRSLGVYCPEAADQESLVAVTQAIENGRRIARDVGGSDPERMAAKNCASYIVDAFKDVADVVKVSLETDLEHLKYNYPLLMAVARASLPTERHHPVVIKLEYTPKTEVKETLLFVGKGITYDTGGADLKVLGIMPGMSRDKCGAAAVAGFFRVLAELQPPDIKAVAWLAMVRNSIGSECYVADEIITSRAGVRVLVRNTDAEGRMVMTDLLAVARETAVNEHNPFLFTIATLTGHAARTVGDGYSVALGNGPAEDLGLPQKLARGGDRVGEPVEISTMRREDFKFVASKSDYEDVIQSGTGGSISTARGHQYPPAFMIVASGLDKHSRSSDQPLPYVHLDIAAAAGKWPELPTGAPILALASALLL